MRITAKILCSVGLFIALLPHTVFAQYLPAYTGIDHVSLNVSDLDRATQFYTHLFGNEVLQDKSGKVYLRLGASYMRLAQQQDAAVVNAGFAISNFDLPKMRTYLDEQAIGWQAGEDDNNIWIRDRDEIQTLLGSGEPWGQMDALDKGLAAQAALLHPLLLDEIYINVTNMEVDSLFYSRVLGQTGHLQAGSLWFDVGNARLRLSQVPVGQAAGINYISILISNTDLAAATEAVFAAGGLIETLLPNGFSFWDPEGLRIVVRVNAQY